MLCSAVFSTKKDFSVHTSSNSFSRLPSLMAADKQCPLLQPSLHQGIRSTLKSHPTIAPQLPLRPKKGVSPLHLNLKPVSDSKLSWYI